MASFKPRILFLTAPEHGQANVHLAVISSLLEHHRDHVDLHLASFKSFRRFPSGVTFHPLVGRGLREMWPDLDEVRTEPGFLGAARASCKLVSFLHAESTEEYIATANDVSRVLNIVKPTFVIVDPLFNAARDAINKSGLPQAVLSPVTIKEEARVHQKFGQFKWPALGSGFPYPLPWYLYPINFLNLLWTALWLLFIDTKVKALRIARLDAGFTGPLPLFDRKATILKFCMSRPDAEIPAIIPEWLVCCGPIVQDSKPVSEADPTLYAWLMARPTVLVVLGSHVTVSQAHAMAMLDSYKVLLDKRRDIQILWKLQKEEDYLVDGQKELGDRLKIMDWFDADPLAILQTGNVICSINHGGSNSYHEALLTGTPQVVLPTWLDCYDTAGRIEYIGVGKWGSKSAAPYWTQPELTETLLAVVGGTPNAIEAAKIRKRAKELSSIVTDGGQRIGRDVAADRIWQEVQKVMKKVD